MRCYSREMVQVITDYLILLNVITWATVHGRPWTPSLMTSLGCCNIYQSLVSTPTKLDLCSLMQHQSASSGSEQQQKQCNK